jgi:hypothetical protein
VARVDTCNDAKPSRPVLMNEPLCCELTVFSVRQRNTCLPPGGLSACGAYAVGGDMTELYRGTVSATATGVNVVYSDFIDKLGCSGAAASFNGRAIAHFRYNTLLRQGA